MAPGAGRNIRMMGCLRRGRAVQIRAQAGRTDPYTRGANRPCGDQRRNIVSCTAKKSPARIIYRTHPITNDNGRATSAVTCCAASCTTSSVTSGATYCVTSATTSGATYCVTSATTSGATLSRSHFMCKYFLMTSACSNAR